MDPMEHYLVRGFSEGRAPCPDFDPRRWARRALDPNPLLGLLRWREQSRLDTGAPNIADEVRRSTRPNAGFEEVQSLPPGLTLQAKLLAYYLPQFHPCRRTKPGGAAASPNGPISGGPCRASPAITSRGSRATSGTTGSTAPRRLRRQIALAKAAGLHGFVFYFYWFNGRRLLEAPLEALLADPSLDMPFCLMWANENWTRRWDGSDDQVLLSQDYRREDEAELIAEFARHFADERYIRIAGRPVLMVYRARVIPDTVATVSRWRRLFRATHGEDPVFIMAQSFGDTDPRTMAWTRPWNSRRTS